MGAGKVCAYCGYAFTDVSGLIRHQRDGREACVRRQLYAGLVDSSLTCRAGCLGGEGALRFKDASALRRHYRETCREGQRRLEVGKRGAETGV